MEPQLQVPDAVMHLDSTFAYDTGALVPDGRDARTGGNAGNSGGNGVRAGARAPHVELIRPHASTGKAGPISSLDLYRDRFTLVTPAEHADAWREAAGSVRCRSMFTVSAVTCSIHRIAFRNHAASMTAPCW